MSRDSVKWLLRGFLLGLGLFVVVIALAVVQGGQAQDGGNPNEGLPLLIGDRPVQQGSDDPLGRPPQPAPDVSLGKKNIAILPDEAAEQEPRTDHPLGVMGGPVVEGETLSNPEVNAQGPAIEGLSEPARQEPANLAAATGGFSSPLVISAADFRSDGFAPEGFMFWFSGGAVYGEGVSGTCLMAPAYLPNGVTVTDMFITAYDNNAGGDVAISLWRVDNYAGTSAQVMASVSTTGASTAMLTPGTYTITYPGVSYPTYSYYLTTCLTLTELRLYSVRIYYTE